jgi:cytochrome c oxidase subunit IV
MAESNEHDGGEHIAIPGYLIVFLILVVGTVVTYLVALQNLDGMFFPGANTLVALIIAFFKMMAVVLYFMHVRWSSKLVWLAAASGFLFLTIIFAFTMQDYLTRSVIGR